MKSPATESPAGGRPSAGADNAPILEHCQRRTAALGLRAGLAGAWQWKRAKRRTVAGSRWKLRRRWASLAAKLELAGEELAQQRSDLGGPRRGMIAARRAWLPGALAPRRVGAQLSLQLLG